MSKHLRFGRLLSLLAIMLTLSFVWAQGQTNLSQLKVLNTFSFTTAANGSEHLGADCLGTINQTAHTVTLTVPFATTHRLDSLIASFTSSLFSNVYVGPNPTDGTLAVSGVSPLVDYSSSVTIPVIWTVEAENHSFVNYAVTVNVTPASTACDLSVFSANYAKTAVCSATEIILPARDVLFSGLNITFNVNYGAHLDDITIYFTKSALSTCNLENAHTYPFGTGTTVTPLEIIVTAEDGVTHKHYLVTPTISTLPSVEDYLLPSLAPTLGGFPAGSTTPVVNTATQIITVTVPYTTSSIPVTWTISAWAQMYTSLPPQTGQPAEICSPYTVTMLTPSKTDEEAFNFWIQAEDPTEVSLWILKVKNADCSTANLLRGIYAGYYKPGCFEQTSPGLELTDSLAQANIAIASTSATTGTITFTVPHGVDHVTVSHAYPSLLATLTPITDVLHTGSTVTVTSECGVAKVYTVTVTQAAEATGKELLSFGFHENYNDGYSFNWPADAWYTTEDGEIDQVTKRITIKVPYSTDLHTLTASFTSSPWSCVYIANTNNYDPQVSEETENDHSNSLTYVVRAEDGTEERYDVEVIKEEPGENKLLGFEVYTDFCFESDEHFTEAGVYTYTSSTVTNIAVKVRHDEPLTALDFSFTASAWATVTQGTTLLSPADVDEDDLTQTFTGHLTGAVTHFFVTSDAGVTMEYIVTVTVRDQNSVAKLLTYKFTVADNDFAGLGAVDAVGVVDEAAKTVMVEIPWDERGKITHLVATFTLSPYALMTRSEDHQILQFSSETPNDFTTPVAYTVWPEDCNTWDSKDYDALTVEYFVTVKIKPYKNTDITAFEFDVEECVDCPLTNLIDNYARRIYVTVPYETDISDLAPHYIGLAEGATISPLVTKAQDWTAGPVTYTVTAPGGSATAVYTVIVENPPCKAHDITAFNLPEIVVLQSDLVTGHGKPVVIDPVNHTIDVIVKTGASLAKVAYTRSLSCFATICCLNGDCQDNNFMDLSDGCHTCAVTAQDESVKEFWTICVHEIDKVVPKVETLSVMAYNCEGTNLLDSVGVKMDYVGPDSTSVGRVFIINQDLLTTTVSPWVPNGWNLADWTGTGSTSVAALVATRKGNWAAVSYSNVDKLVYISTDGLYSGTYWAFAVSANGRISCISDQKLFIDICEKDVATLCDLQTMPAVWRYRITEEVFVTYEETRTTGNIKYVQDATCGIRIQDQLAALPTTAYGEGTGLTNLIGTLVLPTTSNPMYTFVPVCCYLPTASTTKTPVEPIVMNYDEYLSSCYYGNAYQSMLVKVSTPMIVFDDYHGHTAWRYDNADLATTTARGDYDWIIQSVFNSPLITKVIPTVPKYFQGIRTNVYWGGIYGLFTPRREADIFAVTADSVLANPNPADILNVLPGNCKSILINLYNEGVGDAPITAVYLDDRPATDEFHLVNAGDNSFTLPFTLGTWESKDIEVKFCPTNIGAESTTLIVEWGIGKTLEIPINGTTPMIFDMPYYQTFNCNAAPNDAFCPNSLNDNTARHGWSSTYTDRQEVLVYGGWDSEYDGLSVNIRNRYPASGTRTPVYVYTPGFKVTGADPVVSWLEATMAAYYSATDNSPRNLYASTDMVHWTLINTRQAWEVPPTIETSGEPAKGFNKVNVGLLDYVGKTVWFKFEMLTDQPANRYTYWIIDNFAVEQRIKSPVIAGTPNPGDFGGVQVGQTGTLAFTVKNVGISVLKVKSIAVSGAGFTLNDPNVELYPVEVTDGTGTWAYTVGNENDSIFSDLKFTVDFTPTDIGVKTGKVVVTYGLYSDETYEITFKGEGISCLTAAVANVGDNVAPSQNTWYKYTADKFSIVEVNSCHPDQVGNNTNATYAWDQWLYLYSDCNGTEIANNDDLVGGFTNCQYNNAASRLVVTMNEGETLYIFWPLKFPNAPHAYDPFHWNVLVSYPVDGDVCENAIPLTFPVVNEMGNTADFSDDYSMSPCSPNQNYMEGNDVVYKISLPYEGYLNANLWGAYGGIHVLDMCPKEELEKSHCKAFAGGAMGGTFNKKIAEGDYYVIISTWAPPQTVEYLLNMTFTGTGVEESALTSNLSVFPNPTSGKFTVSITNAEATDMTIELVNISGQSVYRNEVKSAISYNDDIDASTFAKGVYYLKVSDAKGVNVKKVVVQ